MSDPYIKNDTRKDSPHRELLDLIPEGFRNAVPISKLASRMGLSESEVQNKIDYAQFDGNIIATIDNGVCIPANEGELCRYVGNEVARLQFKIDAVNYAYKALNGEQLILVFRSEDYEE